MAPERIPGEFRYWENLKRPRVRRQRALGRMVLGFDPLPPDDVVRTWATMYYDADPVAEAFVDEVYLKRGQKAGRAMVDQALAQGVDSVAEAPASLRALFGEMENDPPWLDWDTVERGARVFRRYGTRMFSFAGAVTLDAYQENSVAKPLALTGAYTGESANRRFLETASFWVDVGTPGALRPGGIGRQTALRVRLMHVFVRRRLLQHPDWDLDGWGVPISQADALLTLMGGSVAPGMAFRQMGYRTANDEIRAMLHFWRYVGHLMGVQPRWYPETVKDGLRILFASFVKGVHGAGEDGRNLAHSYVQSYAPGSDDRGIVALRKRWEYGIQLGYTNFFLPGATYRKFGLPKPGLWRFHPLAQAPLIFAAETVRRRSRLADRLSDVQARHEAKRWLRRRLGPRKAEYQAVEYFTR